MKNKITLITPPDYFENNSPSLLLIDLDIDSQEQISAYLANSKFNIDTNIYFYMGENDPRWLLYALGKSNIAFVNLDNLSVIAEELKSYLLSKPHVYFTTQNSNLATTMSIISQNRVPDFDFFLDQIFNKLYQS
jgi:hypothetical protein